MDLAAEVAGEIRRREGRNLVAIGVYGSVARGEDREFSDIDLLVVVSRPREWMRPFVRDGTIVTIHQLTPATAREEVMGPGPGLNDALGRWRSTRALYDPRRLIARLKAHARHPPKAQFHESARRHLLETYEDYGKLRNAIAAGDLWEARETAIWFTGSATGTLLDLEKHVLATGRRASIEARRYGALGKAIWSLRYEARTLLAMARRSEDVWTALVERFRRQGVRVPGLVEDVTGPTRPGPPHRRRRSQEPRKAS